ncbi:hypothetical protein QBC34DRAFT_455083 [Podospora aff. communis PSN243]|uniref:Nephrocystin 3-like N-terminal domain-containing protein n=1 Tax=Podospora aff. communis PSN243 TaxID=3040156 RepID=A0AAV9FZS5_9PEZI|nr:hypothetical protein QBC34DRAFT_455083 [Podospora aff. communis PSN243]
MDPMSALAIVALVVQLSEIGAKLISKGWDAHKKARESEAIRIEGIADLSRELSSLTAAIRETSGGLEGFDGNPSLGRMRSVLTACDASSGELQLLAEVSDGRAGGGSASKSALQRSGSAMDNEKLEKLRKRLDALKSSAMQAAMLFKQRVVQFDGELSGAVQTLKRIDQKLANLQQAPQPMDDSPWDMQLDPSTLLLPELRAEREGITRSSLSRASDAKLLATLQSLAQSGRSISLSDAAMAVRDHFVHAQGASDLRREVRSLLWDKELSWRPEDLSIAQLNFPTSHDPVSSKDLLPWAKRRIIPQFRFQSLSFREDAVAESAADTYSWIFSQDPNLRPEGMPPEAGFTDWLQSSSDSLYWITGKPGAAEVPSQKWAGTTPLVLIRYYAWNAGMAQQKSLSGLKRTLLFHATEQCPALVPDVTPRRWTHLRLFLDGDNAEIPGVSDWEVNECFDNLLSVCGRKVSAAIFIDGLDEFESPPREIVSFIASIMSASRTGVKVCVASRPWVEFDDAYRDAPGLQMHLCTRQDMEKYVAERFQKSRALSELLDLYSTDARDLRNGLIDKAEGVFIWLRVVIDHLDAAATDGCGMSELSDIVKVLPSDMSELYDAIWARIPDHNRRRGAMLILVVETAFSKIEPASMWLIDEHTPPERQHDLSDHCLRAIETTTSTDMKEARASITRRLEISLKRKLASRTRCLLEFSGGVVDFTHRTAREWALDEKVRERLVGESGESFSPHLSLVEILAVKMSSTCLFLVEDKMDFWNAIVEPGLRYASYVCGDLPSNVDALVRALDTIDERAHAIVPRLQKKTPSPSPQAVVAMGPKGIWRGPAEAHWSSHFLFKVAGQKAPVQANTFTGLAAMFSILPYVQAKATSNPRLLFQRATSQAVGILECAIFGDRYYLPRAPHGNLDFHREYAVAARASKSLTPQRLQMVRLLLDQGVEQTNILCVVHLAVWNKALGMFLPHLGMVPLRKEVQSLMEDTKTMAGIGEVREYFSQVAKLLDCGGAVLPLRAARMLIKSRMSTRSSRWEDGVQNLGGT